MTILNPIEKLAELPEWLRGTKAGSEIECEVLAQNRERRDELLAEKTNIERERDETMPGLVKTAESKLAANKKAVEKLRQSELDIRESHYAERRAVTRFDAAIRRVENDLREGADPKIESSIRLWSDELHRVIQLQPNVSNRMGVTGMVVHSNHDALLSLREPIQVAIQALEKLQLENHEDIEAEIEKIVVNLHPIGSVDRNYAG